MNVTARGVLDVFYALTYGCGHDVVKCTFLAASSANAGVF